MSTDLVLKNRDGIRAIAVQVKDYNAAIVACTDEFEKGMLLAEGMDVLRKALTPQMMGSIMAIQGSALGFRTDKDKDGGYDVETVRDCTIEAWLRGFYHVNNEFNIIAGRFYGAKAGFERKVKQFPGLTDLDIYKGTPETQGTTAFITAAARWKLNGISDSITFEKQSLASGQVIDLRVPVRVNSGMIVDAILGKADRKIFYAIYNRLTENRDIIPEGEVADHEWGTSDSPKKVKQSDLFGTPPTSASAPPDLMGHEEEVSYMADCEVEFDKRDKAGIRELMKEIAGNARLSAGTKARLTKAANEALRAK